MPRWLKLTLAGVLVVIVALYASGRLDYALYPIGLNLHACARNGFGATFCGPDLTSYNRRVHRAEQQIDQSERTLTQQECASDPSLSFCP